MTQVHEQNQTRTNARYIHVEVWMCDDACIAAAVGTTFVPTTVGTYELTLLFAHATYEGIDQTTPIFSIRDAANDPVNSLTVVNISETAYSISMETCGHNHKNKVFTWADPTWLKQLDYASPNKSGVTAHRFPAAASTGNTVTATTNSNAGFVCIVTNFNPSL